MMKYSAVKGMNVLIHSDRYINKTKIAVNTHLQDASFFFIPTKYSEKHLQDDVPSDFSLTNSAHPKIRDIGWKVFLYIAGPFTFRLLLVSFNATLVVRPAVEQLEGIERFHESNMEPLYKTREPFEVEGDRLKDILYADMWGR